MNREQESLKAGIFVVIGAVLAVAVVFVLADLGRYLEKKQTVKVYFRLVDGLQGLKKGAAVTLGDQLIGAVISIQDRTKADQQGSIRVVGKEVDAQIPKRYDIYQNAVIELKAPLIGSGTSLNIRSVGQGDRYDDDRAIDGRVAGTPQVQELMREVGIEEEQRRQIRHFIASIDSVATSLSREVPQITQSVRDILAEIKVAALSLQQAVGDIESIVGSAKNRYTLWLDRIDRITESADQSLVAVRNLIGDKEAKLRQALDNVHHLTEVARERTMVQVTEAMDKATAASANLKLASQELHSFVISQRPALERTMANARLASDQLKLAAIEVRRSPWRMLYEPDDKEIDSDNLYDAARSFALAASLLDNTAKSLQVVTRDDAGVDDVQVRKMLDYLETVFAKFQDAETAFWDAIATQSKGP